MRIGDSNGTAYTTSVSDTGWGTYYITLSNSSSVIIKSLITEPKKDELDLLFEEEF